VFRSKFIKVVGYLLNLMDSTMHYVI
jgi:hypothetical protein